MEQISCQVHTKSNSVLLYLLHPLPLLSFPSTPSLPLLLANWVVVMGMGMSVGVPSSHFKEGASMYAPHTHTPSCTLHFFPFVRFPQLNCVHHFQS